MTGNILSTKSVHLHGYHWGLAGSFFSQSMDKSGMSCLIQARCAFSLILPSRWQWHIGHLLKLFSGKNLAPQPQPQPSTAKEAVEEKNFSKANNGDSVFRRISWGGGSKAATPPSWLDVLKKKTKQHWPKKILVKLPTKQQPKDQQQSQWQKQPQKQLQQKGTRASTITAAAIRWMIATRVETTSAATAAWVKWAAAATTASTGEAIAGNFTSIGLVHGSRGTASTSVLHFKKEEEEDYEDEEIIKSEKKFGWSSLEQAMDQAKTQSAPTSLAGADVKESYASLLLPLGFSSQPIQK